MAEATPELDIKAAETEPALPAGSAPPAEAASAPAEAAPTPAPRKAGLQPALPIEQAVTEDKVYCLCCGRGFKMLKRHLGAEHGLTEAEYRAMFNLPADMALVAPSYSRKKASHAKQAGFGKYDRGVQKQDSDEDIS